MGGKYFHIFLHMSTLKFNTEKILTFMYDLNAPFVVTHYSSVICWEGGVVGAGSVGTI